MTRLVSFRTEQECRCARGNPKSSCSRRLRCSSISCRIGSPTSEPTTGAGRFRLPILVAAVVALWSGSNGSVGGSVGVCRAYPIAPTTIHRPRRLRLWASPPWDGADDEEGGPSRGLSSSPTTEEMLERTRRRLEAMMAVGSGTRRTVPSSSPRAERDPNNDGADVDPFRSEREQLYRGYVARPAHQLQNECRQRNLSAKGRKPDLAQRLASHDLYRAYRSASASVSAAPTGPSWEALGTGNGTDSTAPEEGLNGSPSPPSVVLTRFASVALSPAASSVLSNSEFVRPTPIQEAALPVLARGGGSSSSSSSSSSAILHSETGSGKTMAYLLPFTEQLWDPDRRQGPGVAFVLTPTRELASQVASVAASLCPPGSVRLVSNPTHLLRPERAGTPRDDGDEPSDATTTRMYVGSAPCIATCLFGSPDLPAPPTPKPLAIQLLQNCRYLVLDEVDRLLLGAGGGGSRRQKVQKRRRHARNGQLASEPEPQQPKQHVHEKPAAVLTAAIMRHSLGKARVVAASATVGRPLRRELARVMGLAPEECPPVVRGAAEAGDAEKVDDAATTTTTTASEATTRAVTVPESVQHYVFEARTPGPDSTTSPGTLLAAAYQVIQHLPRTSKTLVVLTRGFGISTQNAVGALAHFGCQPRPQSLLDSLQSVSDPPSADSNAAAGSDGYLLVTGEDAVRGLHLEGLDVVVVVGRPNGVDEYTHIAGRTGRAGRPGISLCVAESAAPFLSWESMLRCRFHVLASPEDVRSIALFSKL